MSATSRPRCGYVEVSRALLEDTHSSIFKIIVKDALSNAGMDPGDKYYVWVGVVELPDGCEYWPWEGERFTLGRVARAYDVPPWLVDAEYPLPRFARLRWRLRRIWPIRSKRET